MADTNVPAIKFTATGVVAPAEVDVLAGVQADIDTAFGGGVNPDPTTPQGQLASSEAAIIGAKNDEILYVANMVDPAYAAGRFQDAIGRIYMMARKPAVASTVQCDCIGAQSTIIPSGALATDGTNTWICQQAGTIPESGTISLPFACAVTGPVACPANSVNRISQTIPGWDSVNNPADGVIGSAVESRADFEHRRQLSVQQNGVGPIQSLVGKVLNVAGVIDAYGYQNDTGANASVGGVTIGPGIYVCVSGGDPQAVGEALWSKKIPGAPWNGGTSVTVFDTSNRYTPPYPAYTVKFQTATPLPIKFAVNIANSPQVPSDAQTQVQDAIIAAFTGADDGPRARIGTTIYASRFYAGIAKLGAWAQIVDVLVGTTTANANSVAAPIDHAPTITADDIAVAFV